MTDIVLAPKTSFDKATPAQHNWQIRAYGCDETTLAKELTPLVNVNRYTGCERNAFDLAAMCILSDAQEAIAAGLSEKGRQFINKSKWLLTYHM